MFSFKSSLSENLPLSQWTQGIQLSRKKLDIKFVFIFFVVALLSVFISILALQSKASVPNKSILAGYGYDNHQTIPLSSLQYNASGIDYKPNSNSLFIISNGPEVIVEVSTKGELIREIQLVGFEDTEAISYLGDNRFAILEERRSQVVLVEINRHDDVLYKYHWKSFSLAIFHQGEKKNHGFEGLTFNAATGDLYVVKEKQPRAIFKISGLVNDDNLLEVSLPWNIESHSQGMSDLSGLFFHPDSNHLFVLSDESAKLAEFTPDGKSVANLSLSKLSFFGKQKIPQAEGVTMDVAGNLFIISEPNLLYTLKPISYL